MVNSGLKGMIQLNKQKFFQAFIVLENSITHIETFNFNKKYSLTELIPFDAMCDRFIRTVEVAIKWFKTYEKYYFVDESENFRDLLHVMEKNNFISSAELWVEMRDVRNRIVHDYLPNQIEKIYAQIQTSYFPELKRFQLSLLAISNQSN